MITIPFIFLSFGLLHKTSLLLRYLIELISNMLSTVDWEHIIDKNKDNIQTL